MHKESEQYDTCSNQNFVLVVVDSPKSIAKHVSNYDSSVYRC